MRALLLSDIHANTVALETILMHAPAYDAVWCLGDVIGYGPFPNEAVARLRGLNALTIMGNHDRAALDDISLDAFRGTARVALEWTQRVLVEESCAWLRVLPLKQSLPQYNLTLVHGSPREPTWEYIDTDQIALDNFAYFESAFCFFGHTHRPIAYRLLESQHRFLVASLPETQPYLLQPKLILNPGSAGQPRDGDPRAAYAIYDTGTQILVHHRIEYDVASVQRAMANVGLPARLIARLAQGA